MLFPFDTIVAPITGTEAAAVAVLRISGPASWQIAEAVFSPWPREVVPRLALYGRFSTGDDGLCLPFEEGHSYTGEQSAELSVHGSRASVQALVEACLAKGARAARPGEFTERAFMNGRLDLTQAEGVRDTVEALTNAQLRQANLLREGALGERVREIRDDVLEVLAQIEATVDFSEEVGDLDRPAALARLGASAEAIGELLRTAEAGRILRKGFRIAIVGPPNAGKSSLLNRLLGYDRAIVTEVPGTTRDFVEERLDLGGVPCVVLDTAGLRQTEDPVERIGVERALRVAEAADEVWYVYDAAEGLAESDREAIERLERPVRILRNKSDLSDSSDSPESLSISALTGIGLDSLIRSVSERIRVEGPETVWINDRHAPLLESARDNLEMASHTLRQDLPVDLATVYLQAALAELGQITGETATDDMLVRIFRDFCVGK
jgi:tRNA modification GTPase